MIVLSARRALAASLVVPLLSLAPPGASASASAPDSSERASSSGSVQRANGEVKTNKRCKPDKYKTNYKILSASRAPRITQIKAHFMPPTSRRKVTKAAAFYVELRSQVRLNSSASVGASGIAKVLAKAEAQVDMQLKASGKVSGRGSIRVTDWVRNPTKRNQKFVFFKGWEQAAGGFRQVFCKIYYEPGQSYGPSFVTYRDGKWQSFNISGAGALRCGAGAPDSGLGKLALRIGC